jgi:lipopolysaccharide export LptBFGC system permease protein LptF
MILFMLVFAGLVVAFIGFVIKLALKQKNSFWKGEVIDKKHNQVRDNKNPHKMNNFYYLVVKTEEGREMKVGMSVQMFDKFAVGDKLIKPKGEVFPKKLEA